MKLKGRLGAVWFVFWFAASFLILYPFFALFLSREKWYPKANRLRKVWAWFLVIINFVRVKGFTEFKLPNEPAIYVSNHSSYFDIIAFGLFFPEKGCFMAKMELAKIPMFGIFFKSVDIAVDRSSAIGAHKSFLKAADRVKAGYSVIIFPEGTIWKFAPKLKPFKNGAFKLAIDLGVPIVPVTFYNNFKILPDEKFEFYPRTLHYKIHRLEPTNHLKGEDCEALRNKIFAIIEQELNQKPN
ncbi:MAG: lysophospholipid acyltransferase family protein [bacterium]|nr:lysophospholipid acyltransferase family protein [bacterium]